MLARRASAILLVAALAAGCAHSEGECGGGARTSLSVWPEHGGKIGTTFRLTGARPGEPWRLVLVHEGHVRWRGRAAAGPDGTVKITRRMGDYRGVDHVSVRAYGPGGATCAASADLSDST